MRRTIKTILSCLLALTLLLSTASVAFAVSEMPLNLTVAADLHYAGNDVTGPLTESDGSLYPHATIQGQMNYESEAILKQFLKEFAASSNEILLLAGDLTGGNRLSHTQMAEQLSALEAQGKRVFVTPGNHDVRKASTEEKIDIHEFKEIYKEFGYTEAVSVDESSASYAVDLDSRYRLLSIDSCIYGEDDGQITKSEMTWLTGQVKQAQDEGKTLIAMMHHSLLPHLSIQPNCIHDNKALAKQFANWGIHVVFTGHIHANDITGAAYAGNNIYDVQTGSLIVSPNAYREVSFEQGKASIQSKYITSIDVNDLPEGFSEEQLALMEKDFPTYAYNFFEHGIASWIDKYIGSAHKVGKMLKLNPDSALYGVIDDIMSVLGDALRLPLYGENSVSSMAAKCGVTIPESDYTQISQVAAKIMHGFYRGDAALTQDSVEGKLLLSTLAAGISYAVGVYSTNTKFLNKVYEAFGLRAKITNAASRMLFRKSLTKKIMGAVVSPILDGVLADAYAPGDIQVQLTWTEPVNGTYVLDTWTRIMNLIRAVFQKLFH